jgi:hypothetical protein
MYQVEGFGGGTGPDCSGDAGTAVIKPEHGGIAPAMKPNTGIFESLGIDDVAI